MIGTARAEKHDFLADLGVDECIDYTELDFAEAVEGVDVVMDLIGGDDYGLRSLQTLAAGGLLIAGPGGVSDEVAEAAAGQGKRATGILVEPDGHGLECLAQMVDSGALRVFVEESFPLSQAAEAHERLEYGKARGKYVLTT